MSFDLQRVRKSKENTKMLAICSHKVVAVLLVDFKKAFDSCDGSTVHEVGNTVDEALTKIQGTANKLLTIPAKTRLRFILTNSDYFSRCFVGPLFNNKK